MWCKNTALHVYSYFEKLVRKNVYARIPKGYMGYDQYPVPDTVAVTVHGLLWHSSK